MVENPFALIERRFNHIENLLIEMRENMTTVPASSPADEYLSLKGAAEFLSVAPQTIYQNIKRIPHQKRFGKLYFKRSELMKYLEDGAANR